MTMDACGAYTRTLDNHHSHDSDQLAPGALRAGGRSGRYLHVSPASGDVLAFSVTWNTKT
jgi:hypothetical protein